MSYLINTKHCSPTFLHLIAKTVTERTTWSYLVEHNIHLTSPCIALFSTCLILS